VAPEYSSNSRGTNHKVRKANTTASTPHSRSSAPHLDSFRLPGTSASRQIHQTMQHTTTSPPPPGPHTTITSSKTTTLNILPPQPHVGNTTPTACRQHTCQEQP
jgi:hypothetical protein